MGTGEYYTDAYGDHIVNADDPLATRQYVEAGFNLDFRKNATANRIDCSAEDPWLFRYTCYQVGGSGNIEHVPHVPNMNLEYSLWRN